MVKEEKLGVILKIMEIIPKVHKKLLLVTIGEAKVKIKEVHGALQISNKVKKKTKLFQTHGVNKTLQIT